MCVHTYRIEFSASTILFVAAKYERIYSITQFGNDGKNPQFTNMMSYRKLLYDNLAKIRFRGTSAERKKVFYEISMSLFMQLNDLN